jgi:hypothetical protein
MNAGRFDILREAPSFPERLTEVAASSAIDPDARGNPSASPRFRRYTTLDQDAQTADRDAIVIRP